MYQICGDKNEPVKLENAFKSLLRKDLPTFAALCPDQTKEKVIRLKPEKDSIMSLVLCLQL